MFELNSNTIRDRTNLCIGLDILDPMRIAKVRNIVDQTQEFAGAFKVNIQYWHGTSEHEYKSLTQHIHDYDLPIIADLKVSDIGSSNKAALHNMAMLGFDYVTISPFPGNLAESSENAKDCDIGLISLVLMSNPEARWMIESTLYKTWAAQANQYCEGIVIGTTDFIPAEIIKDVEKLCPKPFVLAPGIGRQGGSVDRLRSIFKERVIYNVGRGITQSSDIRLAAKKYLSITQL